MLRALLKTAAILVLGFVALGSVNWAAADAPAATAGAVSPAPATQLGPGLLQTPLVAFGTADAGDIAAVDHALAAYRLAADPLQTAPLEQYLAAHPDSPWRVSLWLDIGLAHENAGDYVTAIAALNRALAAAGPARHQGYSPSEAVVDLTLANLLTLETGFGNSQRVAALLADPRTVADGGILTSPKLAAAQALWEMRHRPDEAFICGVLALQQLLAAEDPTAPGLARLSMVKSHDGGLSLADLEQAAASAGLQMRAVHVAADAPIPVPSVMHWRMNHYVAILAFRDGRYIVSDPAFGDILAMAGPVLERQGSGYFLVPAQTAEAPGWRLASASEASAIRGGGKTTQGADTQTGTHAVVLGGGCGGGSSSGANAIFGSDFSSGSTSVGCPHYTFDLMLASLQISDNPVGYHPPIGPDAEFQLTYNQQDDTLTVLNLPALPYGGPGQNWSDNWLSFVEDDPETLSTGMRLFLPGGGYTNYSSNGSVGVLTPVYPDGSILKLVSTSPIEYTRTFPDGSEDQYTTANCTSCGDQRLVFLTKEIDRFGNALTLNYSDCTGTTDLCLTSVTDAIGQTTTFTYNSSNSLQLISVTDPFGRKVTIGYNSSNYLNSLTDAEGMHSSFTYASTQSFITAMTTPYGTTTFKAELSTPQAYYPYWLTATDPLGNTERVEFEENWSYPGYSDSDAPSLASPAILSNELLNQRDTFYWDRTAYAAITNKSELGNINDVTDYEKATVYQWQHDSDNALETSGVVEDVLYPLERNLQVEGDTSRIWYAYPNDGENAGAGSLGRTGDTGSLNLPSQIARVLPNGATQLTQINYNAQANVTSRIDPVGRQTNYAYAPNGIDVTQITQNSSGKIDVLGAYTYNGQHEPLTVTDAAGQTTRYSYNGSGQVLSVTNALNQTTTYSYNGKHYLTAITDANGRLAESYTYDNVGRIATATDSQGYTLTYNYDNLDRLIKITYPDNTTTQYKYTNLDITKITDRLGRVTNLAYDADRNLTSVTDPLGRTVHYAYNPDGKLISLTDADGQTTTWTRDIEDRVTAKTYADGTSVHYTYDMSNRLLSRTDALAQVANYSYTTDDRVSGVSYTNAKNPTPSVSFTWDSAYPRIDQMTDGTGTTSYAYVPAGKEGALQLSSETGPAGTVAQYSYGYDALGRISQLTVAGTSQDAVTYDAINRDITDVTPLGTFDTAYLGETNQVSTVTALGQNISGSSGLTSYGYLPNTGDRRLNTITFNAAPASNETLTSDDADRVDCRTNASGGSAVAETYSYDLADRLTLGTVATTGSACGGTTASTESYGLNNADFIGSKSGESTASNNWAATNPGSVNGIGTLTPSGGTGRTYSYDANGNVLSDGVRTYSWDAENRLLSVTEISTGHVSTFAYDGLGRRTAITESGGGGTTGYLWCGSTICSSYSSGTTQDRFLPWGEVDSGTSYYYERDHLGSVVSTTNSSGTTEATLGTDAYGWTLASSGTPQSTFGYAGMFSHSPSGLYLTKNRAYDPYSGRWLSRDPVGEAGDPVGNLYAYVNDDPVNGVDSWGVWGLGVIASGSAEGGAGVIGAGGTASVGGGVFGGGGKGLSVGGFASAGGFAGGPGYGAAAPRSGGVNSAIGGFAGAGGGLFATNASNVGQLSGAFTTFSDNYSLGPVQFSVQIGYSNGIGIFSVTVGPGSGHSVSIYPTTTVTTGASSTAPTAAGGSLNCN